MDLLSFTLSCHRTPFFFFLPPLKFIPTGIVKLRLQTTNCAVTTGAPQNEELAFSYTFTMRFEGLTVTLDKHTVNVTLCGVDVLLFS